MRILVLGAGATGGYFGGRLAEAGRDVTFLVRASRAELLRQTGLRIRSPLGDAHIITPRCVLSEELAEPYDLVILSCKAYDLDEAITSIAPAVGPHTAILPLLNGMRHLDLLDAKFGASKVLGGVCVIAATIGQDGTIIHLNDVSSLAFGERFSSTSPQVNAIAQQITGAKFSARASETIIHDMWEKWVFLATLASSTCLMRASIGDIIIAPNGLQTIESIFSECTEIATALGFAPRGKAIAQAAAMLKNPSSSFTSSMMRDMENHSRIEADHIVGDLLARGTVDRAQSITLLAYTHMKAYEARRASEWKTGRPSQPCG